MVFSSFFFFRCSVLDFRFQHRQYLCRAAGGWRHSVIGHRRRCRNRISKCVCLFVRFFYRFHFSVSLRFASNFVYVCDFSIRISADWPKNDQKFGKHRPHDMRRSQITLSQLCSISLTRNSVSVLCRHFPWRKAFALIICPMQGPFECDSVVSVQTLELLTMTMHTHQN